MIFQRANVEINNAVNNYYIFCIAFILLFYGISVGINITSFSLFLHQMGLSKSQMGNVLAMELAGNLIVAPLFPKLCEKYGIFKVIIVSLIIRNMALMLFPQFSEIKMNMLCLFGFGISGFCLFAAVQYWGASLLKDSGRTTMIAVMNVAFRTGIAIGVSILFFKANNVSIDLFKTSAVFASIIILPTIFIKESLPILPDIVHYTSPSKIVKHSIVPILCVLVSNYVLLALSNFVIIYAIENGVPQREALLINLYMVVGNLLLTIPISYLLDRIKSKIGPLIIILIMMCISVIAIPFVIKIKYLTIIVFTIISAGIGSIYVIGASIISAKFKGPNLATASSIMLMMNAVGGFAGVSTTGAAIGYWGNQGMIISVSILILFFLLFIIYNLNYDE